MEISIETNIVQVTNIAPEATTEQMKTLFGYLGKIEEIRVYPTENFLLQSSSKVCYVRFTDSWSVGVAQHLTNMVFIDRALIVVPFVQDAIPDEMTSMALCFAPTPASFSAASNSVINQVSDIGKSQMITTSDPNLTALGLPEYPPLPIDTEPSKIEEIRRTVYVGNLDKSVTAEQLLKFFNQIGEVKYVRMAGNEDQETRFSFVEFTDRISVPSALQHNGAAFVGKPLKITHSNNAIVKPQAKSSEAAQKEIEEALEKVRSAQSSISVKAVDLDKKENKKKSGSRSCSASRSHDRSRSKSQRKSRSHSRNISRSKRRSRSRHSSRTRRSSRSHRHSRVQNKSRDLNRSSRQHGSKSNSRERGKKSSSRSHSRSKSSTSSKSSKIRKCGNSSCKEKSPENQTSLDIEPIKIAETATESTITATDIGVGLTHEIPISASIPCLPVGEMFSATIHTTSECKKKNSCVPLSELSLSSKNSKNYRSKSKERNRSKSREKCRPKSRERNRSKSRERCRSKSRERYRPRHRERHRSKSRERRRSKSRERRRQKSRERRRSKSRERSRRKSRDRSRRKSRERNRRKSRERSRCKSRERSRHKSRERHRSKSNDWHIPRSQLRSKSPYDIQSTSPFKRDHRSPFKARWKSPVRSRSRSPFNTSSLKRSKTPRSSSDRKRRSVSSSSSHVYLHKRSKSPIISHLRSPGSGKMSPESNRSQSCSFQKPSISPGSSTDIVLQNIKKSQDQCSPKRKPGESETEVSYNFQEGVRFSNTQAVEPAVVQTSMDTKPEIFHIYNENSNTSDHNVGDMDLDSS